MYFTMIISLFLAALVAAVPPPRHDIQGNADTHERGLVTFVMTEPDCPAIEKYCTHCDGDFNCETDPRCEWCYLHDQFGKGSF